ncbi:class II aldolase/adducin family protein [Sphingomonas koreensis]|uniref:Class II aldolase/adducin family protein n=1 Tax=Sphingomonas koreensis TaxID=93064 RepID=A0A430G075_9SPHN|nr:class II aldolase/adducin family protein [Sphingomonas koreensis]RSY79335.1 class II aldolase/adducin family protein [Sphingomonas koreensis]
MSAATPTNAQQEQVRQAARALARAGLVHAYGHCSLRLDTGSFLVCAALPMGAITSEPGTVVSISGLLPDGVLGEVRIHQAIYARRPDVNAVCRIMPPALMSLSTQGIVPRPRHGIGAYFAPQPALWDDVRLLRDDAAAARLAKQLDGGTAIVMRGNGAVAVADGLPKAVTLSWFLEDMARVERDVRMMGCDPERGLLDEDEVVARQVFAGGVVERMWQHLTT